MVRKYVPVYEGNLRKHTLSVPRCISECSGIRVFGRRIKSLVFSTDVAIIKNINADAVIAVYPFTPQPSITQAIIGISEVPVFCGVGGGLTNGVRSASNDGSSLMEELRVAFLLHRLNSSKAAPTGYDILKMATRGSARLLGRDDIGQLAVGKCADLFLIDSRRLELVGSCFDAKSVLGTVGVRGAVDYTVVHGRVTVREGHLATVDEGRVAEAANAKCKAYLEM